MIKKSILLIFVFFFSIFLISAVSAVSSENITNNYQNGDLLKSVETDNTILAESENENSLSHDSDNPYVYIDAPVPYTKVSGIVNIDASVESHYETKFVNFTVENVKTRVVYFELQDNNPSDGWKASWDTSNAPNGKYYIIVQARNVLNLDGKSEIVVDLENQEKNTKIVGIDSIGTIDNPSSIIAYLYDGNSMPLSNKNLTFTIENEIFNAKTGGDGGAIISYIPKEVKNYNVSVQFKGDNLYSPSKTTIILKTLSNTNVTILDIDDVIANNKRNITLKAKLQAPGFSDAIINKQIDFYINNTYVGYGLTDENGVAKLIYNVSQVGGRYIYYAEYNGTSVKDFASFYVPQSELYVTMVSNKSNVKIGDKFKITYSIFNNGPDIAENTTFNYKIPLSLKYINSYPSQGTVSYNSNTKEFVWNLGNVILGKQSLEIIFESKKIARNNLTATLSTITYDESVATGVPTRYLTVKSYAKLDGWNLVKYYHSNQKYKIRLYGDNGKVLGGKIVKIIINKKSYFVKTNKNGWAKLSINLKSGKYITKTTYGKLSISNNIVVKPIICAKNVLKKKSKLTKFTAKIYKTNGKLAVNKKVTFKFKGKKYVVKTNRKGIAKLTLKNLKVGKYSILTCHAKITLKNIIKIKK